MKAELTATAITSAIERAAETKNRLLLTDKGSNGLCLRVTPAGAATWTLNCRDGKGRMRRFMLGAYPTMGLAKARDAARVMYHKVRHDGLDPIAERREARQKTKAAADGIGGTLESLIGLYKAQRGATLRSWQEYERSIGRVFKPFLARPLADLSLGDLQLAADAYPAKQQAALSVRCLRPILRWAAAPGRAYVAPTLAQLSPPATVKARDRVLSPAELKALWPALKASKRPQGAAMAIMALTLCRKEEIAALRWRDLDSTAGTLTIAAERSKNGQAHIVPLSRQARDLLEKRLLVDDQGKRIAPDPEAMVFGSGSGAALSNWDRVTKEISKACGVTGWQRHDLRRTGATLLGELGEMPAVIEAALNHTAIHSRLAATYNRARYRPQVAAALQRLADALDGIEQGAGQVVSLFSAG